MLFAGKIGGDLTSTGGVGLVLVHTRKKHPVVLPGDSLRFHPRVGRMSNSIANLGCWKRVIYSGGFGSMMALVERTSRHQQRYEHGYRLIGGCIPYRFVPAEGGKTVEVLMITSQRGKGLLFPKGGWETDETVEEAACREALEEAGVCGLLQGRLGSWDFKSKRQKGVFCPEGLCRAQMFALAVTEQLENWPEQNARHRQWFGVTEAGELCRHDWMWGALDQCIAHLASGLSTSDVSTASSLS